MKKEITHTLWIAALLLALTACNSNDDSVDKGIDIPGITITDDTECCTAEEAFQVYSFLQTVKLIPELSTQINDTYNIFAYSKTGSLHTGYNELYFVATKKSTGNYVKDFDITNITPLMHMAEMNMEHSTPAATTAALFDNELPALKRAWIAPVMASSLNDTWTLGYNARVLDVTTQLQRTNISVSALPNGQDWIKSFKINNDTYYLILTDITRLAMGSNQIVAYVSKKSLTVTEPYALATEDFTIDIDPRMPDMGNHTSPGNTALTHQADGSYVGTLNITMTGLWRIHLTVHDAQGNVVAGGDNLSDGYSSLFWDAAI